MKLVGTPDILIPKLLKLERDKQYQIEEYREKRGIKANSYYWSLINQLANKMEIGNEELHVCMLRDYGQVMLVPLSPEQNPSGYFPYYEVFKETKIDGKDAIYYKVYKESHTMNSKEFWILIKGLEQECVQQDIEILDERKFREMMEQYEKENK